MSKIATLIRGDIRNIRRDALLLVTIFVPILLAFFLRFGIPLAATLLFNRLGFDLTAHYRFILSFTLLLTPTMLGALAGFILLDDRDESILLYFSITPLTKWGYLIYRTAAPTILCFVFTFAVAAFANLSSLNYASLVPVVLMASLEAPIVALFLGAYASNKVEGLAYTKGMGIIYFAPAAGYLVKSKLQLLAGIFPTYWVTQSFMASFEQGAAYWLYLLMGFFVHCLYLIFFVKKFKVKAG